MPLSLTNAHRQRSERPLVIVEQSHLMPRRTESPPPWCLPNRGHYFLLGSPVFESPQNFSSQSSNFCPLAGSHVPYSLIFLWHPSDHTNRSHSCSHVFLPRQPQFMASGGAGAARGRRAPRHIDRHGNSSGGAGHAVH